jgi:hypothetical protein
MSRPDFRVAHEPIRESDRKPVSGECAVRMLFRNGVHVRRRASLDGITFETFLGGDTPAIMYAVPLQKPHHDRQTVKANEAVT